MTEETRKQVEAAIDDLIDAIVRKQPRKIPRAKQHLKWLAMKHGAKTVADRWDTAARFALAYWGPIFKEQTEYLRSLKQFEERQASDAA